MSNLEVQTHSSSRWAHLVTSFPNWARGTMCFEDRSKLTSKQMGNLDESASNTIISVRIGSTSPVESLFSNLIRIVPFNVGNYM